MLRLIIASLAITMPALVARAQFGSGRGMRDGDTVSAYVIQMGGENLSSEVITIVAQHLKPRLPDWGGLPPASVHVEFQGQRLDAASILSLTVWIPPAANLKTEQQRREVWELARTQLEKELQRVAELAYEAQQVRVERELNEQQAQREKLEPQAAELAEELAMLEADTAGADRDTLSKAIAEAVSNQRGLQLEDAGLRAHRQAIEERIDELRKMAAEEGDPIVSELERIVEIREQARQRLEEANRATPNAVPKERFLDAEGKIAEAKIELLRARREAEDRSSGGALRELTKELSKLMVESAKIEGQRKQLEKTIVELREQVRQTAQAAAKLARLQVQMQQVQSRRQQIEGQMSLLRQSLDQQSEPEITLQPLVDDKAEQAREPEASAPGGSEPEDGVPGTSNRRE